MSKASRARTKQIFRRAARRVPFPGDAGDTSLLETTATVLGVEEGEKGWTAVLDATVFHPQGGGQPSDAGTVGGVAVSSVDNVDGVAVQNEGGAPRSKGAE